MSKTILAIKNLPPETKALLHHQVYVVLQRFLGRKITGDINAPVNYLLNETVNKFVKMEVKVIVEFNPQSQELNMKFGNGASEYLFRTIGF